MRFLFATANCFADGACGSKILVRRMHCDVTKKEEGQDFLLDYSYSTMQIQRYMSMTYFHLRMCWALISNKLARMSVKHNVMSLHTKETTIRTRSKPPLILVLNGYYYRAL
jgi:uncharacterized membrane protein YjgN (DUF898 family)